MSLSKEFKKSTYSGDDDCVQVALIGENVIVGDTKSSNGPSLQFNDSEWTAFIKGVKDGEFDL